MPSSNVLSKRVLARRENKPPTLTSKKYPSLSPTGLSEHWVAMENTRAGRDVTCQYRRGVPRPCHLSQSHACLAIWASTPRMVAPVWALTHCRQCWGASQGLCGSARASHTDTGRGYAGGAGQRRDPEKSWGGNAGLGTREQPGGKKLTDTGKK